jgi:hypothetical protein
VPHNSHNALNISFFFFTCNSYLQDHLEFEVHLNGIDMKNIDLHVTECCIVMLAVAFVRLQHGIKENHSSVAYLTKVMKKKLPMVSRGFW